MLGTLGAVPAHTQARQLSKQALLQSMVSQPHQRLHMCEMKVWECVGCRCEHTQDCAQEHVCVGGGFTQGEGCLLGTMHVRELEELWRGWAVPSKTKVVYQSCTWGHAALALGHLADKGIPPKSPFSMCLSPV